MPPQTSGARLKVLASRAALSACRIIAPVIAVIPTATVPASRAAARAPLQSFCMRWSTIRISIPPSTREAAQSGPTGGVGRPRNISMSPMAGCIRTIFFFIGGRTEIKLYQTAGTRGGRPQ